MEFCKILLSHIHLKISNLFNYITDNAYLASNSLQTSVEENIFLPLYLYFFQYKSTWFYFMSISNYFIADYMVFYDLHRIPDSISENISITKVVTYLFQFLNIILVTEYQYLRHISILQFIILKINQCSILFQMLMLKTPTFLIFYFPLVFSF